MRVAHDGALLPIIKEAKKSQRERNFYVVHLMGNHMDYKKRYPEEFDKFKSVTAQNLRVNLDDKFANLKLAPEAKSK